MAETIRDVIIRVAIEQKNASLKMPDVTPIETANVGVAKSMQDVGDAAAKEYDRAANEAMSAYSRIMKSREEAEKKAQDLSKQTQSAQSELLGVYAQTAGAAMQLGKGIAFVTAANEEEADSFVKSIAAAQGYYDAAVGSIQVVKSLGDMQRKAAAYIALTTAATTTQGVAANATSAAMTRLAAATVAATGAATAFGTALLATPLGWIALATAAAAAGIIAWNRSTTSAAKEAAEAMDRSISRQVEDLQKLAKYQQEVSSLSLSQVESNDSVGLAKQLEDMEKQRKEFAQKARNVPMGFENRQQVLSGLERQNELQQTNMEMLQKELEARGQLKSSLESELSVAQQILRTAQDTAAEEENRNKSELIRLGLLSQADKSRVKRLYDAAQNGPLSLRQAQEASRFGILQSEVAATAAREAERSGITSRREASSDNQPLEQARKNLISARNTAGLAIEDIKGAIEENEDAVKELAVTVKNGFAMARRLGSLFDEVKREIEDFKRENDKRWIKLREPGT